MMPSFQLQLSDKIEVMKLCANAESSQLANEERAESSDPAPAQQASNDPPAEAASVVAPQAQSEDVAMSDDSTGSAQQSIDQTTQPPTQPSDQPTAQSQTPDYEWIDGVVRGKPTFELGDYLRVTMTEKGVQKIEGWCNRLTKSGLTWHVGVKSPGKGLSSFITQPPFWLSSVHKVEVRKLRVTTPQSTSAPTQSSEPPALAEQTAQPTAPQPTVEAEAKESAANTTAENAVQPDDGTSGEPSGFEPEMARIDNPSRRIHPSDFKPDMVISVVYNSGSRTGQRRMVALSKQFEAKINGKPYWKVDEGNGSPRSDCASRTYYNELMADAWLIGTRADFEFVDNPELDWCMRRSQPAAQSTATSSVQPALQPDEATPPVSNSNEAVPPASTSQSDEAAMVQDGDSDLESSPYDSPSHRRSKRARRAELENDYYDDVEHTEADLMELNTVDDPERFRWEEMWCNHVTSLRLRSKQIQQTIAHLRGGYVSNSTVGVAAPKSGC
jgi:hypothetical protein